MDIIPPSEGGGAGSIPAGTASFYVLPYRPSDEQLSVGGLGCRQQTGASVG